MLDRIVSWGNVIFLPLVAATFVYDLWAGIPADWGVWFFAFLGLFMGLPQQR